MQNFIRPFPKADRFTSNLNDSFIQFINVFRPEKRANRSCDPRNELTYAISSNFQLKQIECKSFPVGNYGNVYTGTFFCVFGLSLLEIIGNGIFLSNPVSVVGEADFDLDTSTPLRWGADSLREAHGRLCRFPGQYQQNIWRNEKNRFN